MRNNNIKSIINNVIHINKKYKEIKKIKGENFNIFSILKLERNEVKTHSNFIYELLNSKGSHNQGSLFLKLFIEQVLKLSDYGNIEKVKAHQEYPTKAHRRIDFVIETEKYQIGIEMKIDAKDQYMQLADYMTELKRARKEEKLFYLTLNGYQASKESIGDEKIDYIPLSFENDIYNWIITCIEKSATVPLLREGLTHYKNLIATITNKISKPMEKEMEELIKTPNEIEAVQNILNEYPKIWAKKEMDFLDKLKEELKNIYIENSFKLIDEYDIWSDEYTDTIENIMNKKISGFVLQKEYTIGYFVDLCMEIDKGDIFILIYFYDKDKDKMKLNEDMKKICDDLDFNQTYKNQRYKNIEDIIFFSDKQTDPTYDLFDINKFNDYVQRLVKEITRKINYLIENEKNILEALSS